MCFITYHPTPYLLNFIFICLNLYILIDFPLLLLQLQNNLKKYIIS